MMTLFSKIVNFVKWQFSVVKSLFFPVKSQLSPSRNFVSFLNLLMTFSNKITIITKIYAAATLCSIKHLAVKIAK